MSLIATEPATLTSRERFLDACDCEALERPPVWLMRQAGRALPEYRALKEKYTFLELVRTPDLAAEVTLQPVRRFGFDAAILFSDILVVPEALGQGYRFREEGGIEMTTPIKDAADIDRLNGEGVCERLDYVREALVMLREELPDTALLGFAGSPWTLANFMLEGGSAREFTKAKILFYSDRIAFQKLLKKLTAAVFEFLEMQIDAGVDAIQIFDSLGSSIPRTAWEEASGQWIRSIIMEINGRVPVILFAKGVNNGCVDLLHTGADVLGYDWGVDLARVAHSLPSQVAVQGNLDPALLQTTPRIVETETERLLTSMEGRPGHILNLGHGVTPAAKIECIEALVNTVQSWGKTL